METDSRVCRNFQGKEVRQYSRILSIFKQIK
jgi:hypothetical protein